MDPALVAHLETQAYWCRELGSPLYAGLMDRAVGDEAVAAVLAGHEQDPPGSVLAMRRLLGAVNRIVLENRAPELGDAFATGDPEVAWPLWRALIAERAEEVKAGLDRGVQTNESQRCSALLGGFLTVARETGLPLALLELGSSAGLNLRWDQYRYEDRWGPEDSPVRLDGAWTVAPPLEPAQVEIAERRGCDPRPVDPATQEGQITLLSYVWPDMDDRVERLRAALSVAAAVPAEIETIDGAAFVERELAAPREGAATVLFHSIVWQYVPHANRARIEAALAAAGERATPTAPLAWLRLEPSAAGDGGEVRLRSWPGGEERLLATATFHGRDVRWQTS